MSNPERVFIDTSDGLKLPGFFFSPKVQAAESEHSSEKTAVIYLHGNGSSSVFHPDDDRTEYAVELMKKGIAFLEFDNRGALNIKRLKNYRDPNAESKRYGMAYEIIKECVFDIDGAIKLLHERGYTKIYLSGESTGANKICVYDHYKENNQVAGYILLASGDDVGIYFQGLGEELFWNLLAEAKLKIDEGKGEELIVQLLPSPIFSYQAFFDIANPDGDYNVFPFYEMINQERLSKIQPLFDFYKNLTKPTLTIFGSEDEYSWGDVQRVVDILKDANPTPVYEIIEGADHEFSHHRPEVGRIMAEWIANTILRKRV